MVDMRLDLWYFADYNIEEKFPDQSTIYKTRKRISEEVFEMSSIIN